MNSWRLWVYLQTTPLFWLTATLGAFFVADWTRASRRPQPSRQSRADLGRAGGEPAETQRRGLSDLFQRRAIRAFPAGAGDGRARRSALSQPRIWSGAISLPMAAALIVGAVVAIVSAVGVAKALGASKVVLISLAPKSVTAGVAMAVTRAARRPAVADRRARHSHRHSRRDHRHADDERAADSRLCGARLRGRPRLARHRHRARLHGRSGRRRVRGRRDGAQCGGDAGARSAMSIALGRRRWYRRAPP